MKINEFLFYDEIYIDFPEYQSKELKNFAKSLKKTFKPDIDIFLRPSNETRKRNFKDKDIEALKIKLTKHGIKAFLICMAKFEDLLKLRAVREMFDYDIPKNIRDIYEDNYEELNNLLELIQTSPSQEITDFFEKNSNLMISLDNIDFKGGI